MSDVKENLQNRRTLVAVIGASSAERIVMEMAERVGAVICAEGWNLLTGGGGGVMEAACRGFRLARTNVSGLSIGILPTDDARSGNGFLDVSIPTGMGIARNAIIARAAQGLIAVGGCAGTLSEIALAWQLDRPIAALAESGGWAAKTAGAAIDGRRSDVVFPARTPEEAVGYLKHKISSR